MNIQRPKETPEIKTPPHKDAPKYPEIPSPIKVDNDNEKIEEPAMPNDLYKEILPPDTRVIS